MSLISALANVHHQGQFGDFEDKKGDDLLKISEKKNLLIVQIVQFKNSNIPIESIDIDGLKLKDTPLNVSFNDNTRILWNGPKNWLLVSSKKDLINDISSTCKEIDFAITDLSHSRAVIDIEGNYVIEVLKKGSPFNFDELKKNNSINSLYNNIAFTVDLLNDKPFKVRLFTLRSFGESLSFKPSISILSIGILEFLNCTICTINKFSFSEIFKRSSPFLSSKSPNRP